MRFESHLHKKSISVNLIIKTIIMKWTVKCHTLKFWILFLKLNNFQVNGKTCENEVSIFLGFRRYTFDFLVSYSYSYFLMFVIENCHWDSKMSSQYNKLTKIWEKYNLEHPTPYSKFADQNVGESYPIVIKH